MASPMKCHCGRDIVVEPAAEGKLYECPFCKKVTRIPAARPAPPPRPAPVDPEDDDDPGLIAPVEQRPGFQDIKHSKGTPQECYRCRQVTKGKTYCFVAGFYAGKTEKAIHARVRVVSTIYRNMERHGIFLCPACARALVQWAPMVFSLVCGMLALFLLVIGAGLLLTGSTHFVVRNGCLIAGGLFFVLFGAGLWQWLTASVDRENVEKCILPIARRHFRNVGDTFWTWTEHQENRKLMED